MKMENVLGRSGRETKNLAVNYLAASDDDGHRGTSRKPPQIPKTPVKKRSHSTMGSQSGPRVRSASTGRDKKSELQARYWALLFGNLQRAVNEIYKTVECYEHISSCQEAILVLENYVRDFKALAAWFRVSWDYDSTPLPQRPQSLAWEVRKSNPLPRKRARSMSSPSPVLSGKSSPSYSGKSSPNSAAIEESKLSPRKKLTVEIRGTKSNIDHVKSPKINILELFAAKPMKKIEEPVEIVQTVTQPSTEEICNAHELTKIPEESKIDFKSMSWNDIVEFDNRADAIAAKECDSYPEVNTDVTDELPPVERCDKYCETDLEDENLTLAALRKKYRAMGRDVMGPEVLDEDLPTEPTAVEITSNKLDDMENDFLSKNVINVDNNLIPRDNVSAISSSQELNSEIKVVEKQAPSTESKHSNVLKDEECKKTTANSTQPLKYSSVLNKTTSNIQGINNKPMVQVSGRPRLTQRSSVVTQAVKPLTNNVNATIKRVPVKSNSLVGATVKRNSVSNNTTRKPLETNRNPQIQKQNWGPTNVANRMTARSQTMVDVYEQKKANRPFNPLSKRLSREDLMSSSSTLKASTEKVNGSRTSISGSQANLRAKHDLISRRSEPKSMPSEANSNDGWLTVKTKRRSSLHWSNRFNQPTGYASLPTLALLNQSVPEEDTKELTENRNDVKKELTRAPLKKIENKIVLRKAPSATKREVKTIPAKAAGSSIKVTSKTVPTILKNVVPLNKLPDSSQLSIRDKIGKRQKSDLTGLKIKTLHKEYLRSEKLNQKNENKLEKSPESVNEPYESIENDSQHCKVDMNTQTNVVLSKAVSKLYTNCLDGKDSQDEDCGVDVDVKLDVCGDEDNDVRCDFESDEDQRKLLEEQESLERQIRELESTEIDVDTETDETDCEVILDVEESECNGHASGNDFENESDISLEIRYQSYLDELSYCERDETLATLQAFVSRHPGRAQELHQKLSSPSRRRSLHESLKKYQAKQARAKEKRESLQKDKAVKIQQLLARVEDVKQAKQQLIEDKRVRMEERLQRAAVNRHLYLKDKVRKAHDEEEKMKEIAFIKNLEAQNKRLDIMESSKELEVRLQDLEIERQKKVDDKAAKEAAVERRRQELEQERQRKLQKMNETRLEREQRIGKMQEEKDRQRLAMAREKARDREERMLALQMQKQQMTDELQRKILQKQQESARRHEENIEHIRQRAQELSIPSRNVDENGQRMSSVDRGDGDMSSTVSDVSREHTKAFKKKFKKLKQRMSQYAEQYMSELPAVPMHMKRESQVPKLLGITAKGGGPQGIERPLGQLLRLMSKGEVNDFQCMWLLDGLNVLGKVIRDGMESGSEISKRAVILAVQVYRNSCSFCPQILRHAILGNSVVTLFDALHISLQTREEQKPTSHRVELSTELMLACTVALSATSPNKQHQTHPKLMERLPDLVSYCVNIGLVDMLARRCSKIREAVEPHQSVVLSLLATLGILTKLTELCPKGGDITKFQAAARSTELFGTVSLLYSTIVPIGETIPPRTVSLAAATLTLMVAVANLDLATFQDILGEEATSYKFLDAVTMLLKYCGPMATDKSESQIVIIDLVSSLGFFCANNKHNQDLLTSEQSSIIIKSLAKLPKEYHLIIYPTLVTIVYDNAEARAVVGRDFNTELLDEYQQSDCAKRNLLVSLASSTTPSTKSS